MKQSILITGTSTGFGKLTVQTLAKDGHQVFATMRGVEGKNKQLADELKAWAKDHTLDVQVVELDVTSEASVQSAADHVLGQTDRLDVVVNNAGVYAMGIDETFTVEDYQKIFEVNVYGPLRVNRAFLPQMRKQGSGLIVQVSSIMGRFVIPFNAAYTSSKWAVEAMAESLRYELAPAGIDSVIVQPGAFPTEIFHKVVQGSNQAVAADYAPTLPYLKGFSEGFQHTMSGEVPNHPQHVADAIKRLVDTPAGERPLRVIVDKMMEGTASTVNKAGQQVQENFLAAMQLSDLAQTKKLANV